MSSLDIQDIDLLVVGSGIAGLSILDHAVRRGLVCVGVESDAIGRGQSISAQGIIHGGLKYTLKERDLDAADSIRAMPEAWRRFADAPGAMDLDLRDSTMLSPCTWVWRTDSIASRIGMLGAKTMLRTRTDTVPPEARPELLRTLGGKVLRVEEPVFDTRSVLEALAARNRSHLVAVDGAEGIELRSRGGRIETVVLRDRHGASLEIRPRTVVLSAGVGNESLLSRLGLEADVAQRRPLHMTLLRGRGLPDLFGHCVDGNKTRVTITSNRDGVGRTVWQIGGEIAERGVGRTSADQCRTAAAELAAALPPLDLDAYDEVAWSSYEVDRAEKRTTAGWRPDDVEVHEAAPGLLVAWPTKWALAPRLAAAVIEALPIADGGPRPSPIDTGGLERPTVASFPWEDRTWIDHRDVRSAAPA